MTDRHRYGMVAAIAACFVPALALFVIAMTDGRVMMVVAGVAVLASAGLAGAAIGWLTQDQGTHEG